MATSIGTLKYRRYQNKIKNSDFYLKWYARAVQDRTVDFEDFVTHMSEHNSPYSRGVIHGVLTDMLDCLKELVLDGKSVRLGDLGLFSVGISTKPADTAEAWNLSLVKDVHLNVRNTKTWSNTELRKLCRFSELESYSVDGTASGDGSGSDSGSGGSSGGNTGTDGGGSGSGSGEGGVEGI